MTTNRKQHYLPQMYTAGFTDSTGKLFAHDLSKGVTFLTTPFAIGKETDYYLDRLTDGTGQLDALLSDSEGRVAPVIQQLRERGSLPPRSSIDFRELMNFVSLAAIRSPAARETVKRIGLELASSIISDPTITDSDWARLNHDDPISTELLAANELLLKLKDGDGAPLSRATLADLHWLSIDRVRHTLPRVLHDRRWHVGRAESTSLVTCDAPVLLERVKQSGELGFANDNCNVVMCLSPELALIGRPSGKEGGQRVIWPRRVEELNGLAVMAARLHVVSRSANYTWRGLGRVRMTQADALALQAGRRAEGET